MKILFLTLLISGTAFAQSNSRFAMVRTVIGGGGTTLSTSARFRLGSTIGQPIAGTPASSRFSIQSGFWIWPAPELFAPTKAGDNFMVSFETEPGKTYVVQHIDFLASTNWQNLPGIAGDGSVKTVTNSAQNVSQRYYRLKEQ